MRHYEMYLNQCIYKFEKAERARDKMVKDLQVVGATRDNYTDD